ncbi:MAG TPA: LON peptidase substrate-binding domain-containing protein [Acidimicrobiia bacterium]|nr:LON peptidase substrate-binding domain-containing protein [Acidimicrobiia bacterium]
MILPMFPLGLVVFPFTAVPLRIFEPRYRRLLDRVLAGEATFGTVLIERGQEVGGGDERFSVGTLVKLAAVGEPEEAGDRYAVVAGIGRIEVQEWFEDDPYPQAEVIEVPDAPEQVGPDLETALCSLRRVLALASELGADVSGIGLELANDPVAASYQLAALCPVTALDSHRLLAAPGPATRLRWAAGMLDERAILLQAELAGL